MSADPDHGMFRPLAGLGQDRRERLRPMGHRPSPGTRILAMFHSIGRAFNRLRTPLRKPATGTDPRPPGRSHPLYLGERIEP